MRRIARTVAALSCALALPAAMGSPARAQAQDAAVTVERPLRIDAFATVGYGSLSGGVSEGGGFGSGSIGGLGLERAFTERLAWRVEAVGGASTADLGTTGIFSLPTSLIVNYLGAGLGLRRYDAARTRFFGAGLTVLKVTDCDVDTDGGPGFLGGQSESCRGFGEIALRPRSAVAALNAAAGLRLRKWTLGVRMDAGLQPTVESDGDAMRTLHAGLLVQYHSGRP